jgi:hypothetical protein
VIFVRYTGTQSPHEEWIYNLADIDAQPVIWAQDMGGENGKFVAYYPGRSFRMFRPDVDPGCLQPYKKPVVSRQEARGADDRFSSSACWPVPTSLS